MARAAGQLSSQRLAVNLRADATIEADDGDGADSEVRHDDKRLCNENAHFNTLLTLSRAVS